MRVPIPLFLLAAACSHGAPEGAGLLDEGSVGAAVSEDIATVVFVVAETTEEATVVVEYGTDEGYGLSAPATAAGTTHEATLLGLRAEQTYHYRLVATAGETVEVGVDHTFTTGALPDELPTFDVVTPEVAGTWGDFSLVGAESVDGTSGGIFVVDDDGAVVWYAPELGAAWAELTDDGDVVYLSRIEAGQPELVRRSLDGRTEERIAVAGAHHAGALVPGLVAALIVDEVRVHEGDEVVGDKIVEVAEDGTITEVWSAWDTLEVEQHEGWDGADGRKDWTHANGLHYDPSDDTYVVSLYWLETILKVDRTGQVIWQFGGAGSDFVISAADWPGHLHAPEMLADGRLAYFANVTSAGSAIVAYTLDDEAGTAVRSFAAVLEDGRQAAVLGEVDELPDGSWFTTWGDMRQVAVLTPEGEVAWRLEAAEVGTILGQGRRVASLYF